MSHRSSNRYVFFYLFIHIFHFLSSGRCNLDFLFYYSFHGINNHVSDNNDNNDNGISINCNSNQSVPPRNLILPDHDPSEFSDAVSDTTLLDTESAGGLSSTTSPQVHSSGTSGIGSSKPSMASLTSSYRG